MNSNKFVDWIEGLKVRSCLIEGEMDLRVGYLARLLKEVKKRISGCKHSVILFIMRRMSEGVLLSDSDKKFVCDLWLIQLTVICFDIYFSSIAAARLARRKSLTTRRGTRAVSIRL